MKNNDALASVINEAVTRFYQDGPQNSPGPAGHIIAALGWSGFWISEDVTPVSEQAVRTLRSLSTEISNIDLREWAAGDVLRHRQVDEIDRLRLQAGKVTARLAQASDLPLHQGNSHD
jgi:hypothetical protein